MTYSGKNINLLIIEDNRGDLLLIKDYLNEEFSDPKIYHAETFAKANDLLHNDILYDAILLDLSLPDCNGEALVKKIIDMASHAPVIVLTGYDDKDFGIKTLSIGVSDYLLKDELTASILYKSIAYSIERNRIAIQLNESEKKYRNLFQLSPLPMWVYDIETLRFLNINDAAIKHYGYTKEEFLNMTIKEIRPLEERNYIEDIVAQRRLDGAFHHGIFRHLKRNGEVIHVDIQSNEIVFNNNRARLVLATDISERISYIKAIEDQNMKMQEIAWIQSHVVRAPLARIMGLINLLRTVPSVGNDQTDDDVLQYIFTSANELDDIIRSIVKKTELIDDVTNDTDTEQ
jgi:PAS domain S-box-containing protein